MILERRALIAMLIFVSLTCAAIAFFLAAPIYTAYTTSRWTKVPATVLDSSTRAERFRARSGAYGYRCYAKIHYQYTIGGTTYNSAEIGKSLWFLNESARMDSIAFPIEQRVSSSIFTQLEALQPQQTILIAVNPRNPASSVLPTEVSRDQEYAAFLVALLLSVAAAAILACFQPAHAIAQGRVAGHLMRESDSLTRLALHRPSLGILVMLIGIVVPAVTLVVVGLIEVANPLPSLAAAVASVPFLATFACLYEKRAERSIRTDLVIDRANKVLRVPAKVVRAAIDEKPRPTHIPLRLPAPHLNADPDATHVLIPFDLIADFTVRPPVDLATFYTTSSRRRPRPAHDLQEKVLLTFCDETPPVRLAGFMLSGQAEVLAQWLRDAIEMKPR